MENNLKILNRDTIKYIAIVAMICQHTVSYFRIDNAVLYNVGYITAPIMCYFLVEGYHRTHNKIAYGLRLLIFGALSQVSYLLLWVDGCNMIITLCICFLILCVQNEVKNKCLKVIICTCLTLSTSLLYCQWHLVAPVFVILLNKCRNSKVGTAFSFITLYAYLAYITQSLLAPSPVLSACICILFFYNGKRCTKHKTLNKWAFYIIYPLHFPILAIISYIK